MAENGYGSHPPPPPKQPLAGQPPPPQQPLAGQPRWGHNSEKQPHPSLTTSYNSHLNHNHYQDDCSEKAPLLGSSRVRAKYATQESVGSLGVSPGSSSTTTTTTTTTYYSRFWMLAVFSLLCWMHNVEWIMWGPISETMAAAFPGWGASTVALMVNWGTMLYVVCVLPQCWATQRYGLRAGVVASAVVLGVGSVLRCLTTHTPAFTVLCHLSSVCVGLSSPVLLSAPTLIASDWFPASERTTATAIMVGAHQLGGVASYLEPLLVRSPGPSVTLEDMRKDVQRLTFIAAMMAVALVVAVVAYFPSKPPSPPSLSSSETRVRFLPGLKALVRKKKFMVVLATYGVSVGPPIMWLSVINYSLLPLGFHQDATMWVGVAAVLSSSLSPVLSGRLNDLLQGHTKTVLLSLMGVTSTFFVWFLLLSLRVLPVTDWQVYVSSVGGIACSYATLPLFLEVGIDLAFPVPEILVTGVIIAADNVVGVVFFLLFNIPSPEHLWVTYVLALCSSLTMIPVIALTFPSTRMDIDRG